MVQKLVKWGFYVAETPVSLGRLLYGVATPAIAVRPEWASWAGLSFWIIDPLLVWAADDTIRHNDRFSSMILHEPEDLGSNDRICPNVVLFGEPALQCSRLGILRVQNGNRDFAGACIVGPVESDSRDWITTKATACLPFQR